MNLRRFRPRATTIARRRPHPPEGRRPAALAALVWGAAPPYRFVLGWGFAWALVGCLVAGGIAFSRGVLAHIPVLLVTSVLFADLLSVGQVPEAAGVEPPDEAPQPADVTGPR
jgi:hypothetical protein